MISIKRKAALQFLILVLIHFFSFSILRSQEYIPIAVEGAQWIISYDDINTPQPVDDLWEYSASGDTTIEVFNYKKVYRRSLVPTYEPPPFEPIGTYELYGLIRDDSLHKKVYAILLSDSFFCPVNEDFLLYDYSIQVGDTAKFCLIPDFTEYVLVSIIPGVYLGFETRIFSNGLESDYYEGMGSYYGLFEPMFTPVKSANHRYTYHTYLYYYCREAPCNLVVSVPETNVDEPLFQVYPSPALHSVIVALPKNNIAGEIVIMNIQGQTIIRKSISALDEIVKIDIGSLSSGLYVIGFLSDEVLLRRQKFIVSR